jgi:hypothetical protein
VSKDYSQSQIEFDKTISTFVLKTSLILYKEAEVFLEEHEKSNKEEFHDALKSQYQSIVNKCKSLLDFRDVLIKDINKNEAIEILENNTFKNIFIEYKPENFNHFCKDDIDFDLIRLEFQYLYCQFRITIDYSIKTGVVISLNFDDKSLLHFVDYYFYVIEDDFLKDLAINDIEEMITRSNYTEEEYNEVVESALWGMNIATMMYSNTDSIEITNEKLNTIECGFT